MSRYFYDLHLHSCLSPCGDGQMTPPNLVGTAKLNGLDLIALTDHNTTKNCPAAVACGREYGILVLPGMELTTAEEAHVVCLFPDLAAAARFEEEIDHRRLGIRNDPEIFGRQIIMDEEERVLGEYPELLTAATGIGCFEAAALAARFGGAAYPAHIDRDSFSVVSSLGFVSEDMGFHAVEFSVRGMEQNAPEILAGRYPAEVMRIVSSDAHYLEQIASPCRFLELEGDPVLTLLSKLRGESC